jgi:hypothetical protein
MENISDVKPKSLSETRQNSQPFTSIYESYSTHPVSHPSETSEPKKGVEKSLGFSLASAWLCRKNAISSNAIFLTIKIVGIKALNKTIGLLSLSQQRDTRSTFRMALLTTLDGFRRDAGAFTQVARLQFQRMHASCCES